MASKNDAIKKAVKQLRTLLHNLDEGERATPLIKNLLASLTKTQLVTFNKRSPNATFNKKLAALKVGGFNKTLPNVKFNKVTPTVKFNKRVAALPPPFPFNKRSA